jgi:large subunit ribosomal protein L31e
MADENKTKSEEKVKDKKEDKKTDAKKKVETKKLEDYKTMGEGAKDVKEEKKDKSEESKKVVTQKSSPAVESLDVPEKSEVKGKKPTKKTSKKKGKEEKPELERVYVVPLRKGYMKVPQYKRAKKAVKTLKEFLAKHMKVEDRDITKVKVDIYLNNEIWFKGIKKPLNKVKVKAVKKDGIVYAELAEMPDVVKFNKARIERRKTKVDKKQMDKVVSQEAAEEKVKADRSDKSDKTETKEKEAASQEAGLKLNKEMAKTAKHTVKAKDAKMDNMSATTQRKAMKK